MGRQRRKSAKAAISAATTVATSAATEDDLKTLWKLMLDHCKDYMNLPPEKRDWKHMLVIRAFLKDNGMTVDSAHVEDVRESLKKLTGIVLPFPTEEAKLGD